jgi:hypothetical protein
MFGSQLQRGNEMATTKIWIPLSDIINDTYLSPSEVLDLVEMLVEKYDIDGAEFDTREEAQEYVNNTGFPWASNGQVKIDLANNMKFWDRIFEIKYQE